MYTSNCNFKQLQNKDTMYNTDKQCLHSDPFWPGKASGESCICIGPQRWVGIINGQTYFSGTRTTLNGA